MHVKSLAFCVW